MIQYRILITSIFLHPGGAVDRRLRAERFETVFKPLLAPRSEDQLIDLLPGGDGAIVAGDPFTARVLEASPQLKAISRTGVGLQVLENVYLSPHVGGVTTDSRQFSGTIAADNLICALKGEQPPGILNPDVLTR